MQHVDMSTQQKTQNIPSYLKSVKKILPIITVKVISLIHLFLRTVVDLDIITLFKIGLKYADTDIIKENAAVAWEESVTTQSCKIQEAKIVHGMLKGTTTACAGNMIGLLLALTMVYLLKALEPCTTAASAENVTRVLILI